MAERRMMSKKITDTDAFLEMPLSSQALYLHYIQNADDDGFVGNPISIMRKIGANKNDYDLLIAKRFVIVFESGICVIKHWRIHNYIQSDRYTPTTYIDEKQMLSLEENKAYTLDKTKCIQNVYNMDTQISIDKNNINKNNIDNNICVEVVIDSESKNVKHKYGEYKNVLLKDSELEKLKQDYPNWEELIKCLDEYIEMKGAKYKSHYLAIKKWVVNAVKQNKVNTNNGKQATKREYTKEELNSLFDDISEINI